MSWDTANMKKDGTTDIYNRSMHFQGTVISGLGERRKKPKDL